MVKNIEMIVEPKMWTWSIWRILWRFQSHNLILWPLIRDKLSKLLESCHFMQGFNGQECFPRNRTHDCASKREIMCSTYRHKGGMQNNFSWERCKIPQLFCTAKSCLLDTRNGTSPSKSYFKHFLIANILVKFKLNEYFFLQKGVF